MGIVGQRLAGAVPAIYALQQQARLGHWLYAVAAASPIVSSASLECRRSVASNKAQRLN